ncbi:hypothetical protein JOF41_005212 [Saccharothrix coeruleofusca]|uniref:NACHT domain-containing protein n=1 Tax=Saccharothrix coeruleofusca TaxID=33919 RepID=UPI001AE1C70D|nr:hypothetical protein [Saccharothrix coeruleofusca]MBP2339034.1 hypothetical protein [Saccharothrix coeruleofusca]
MSTPYESLNEHTFQQLVQALLVAENPKIVSFPIGMPDGGRDAMLTDPQTGGSVVYQVKFARDPAKIADPYAWLTKAIDGEVAKVQLLAERGITEYVLVTNLKGTSHLDAGLMDKALSYLRNQLGVPSRIMWRDDLDRRLDNNFGLKLRYPQLLNGPDILRLFWEAPDFAKDDKRRKTALQAYLRDQYERDRTIRFKQVELLSSSLLDLFIDVPAIPSQHRKRIVDLEPFQEASYSIYRSSKGSKIRPANVIEDGGNANDADDEFFRYTTWGDPKLAVGAADLLTNADFTNSASRIVIEGAPGQGKSTLSQYLAQVQRIRLLNKESERRSLPTPHSNAPIALPIKLELRDVAGWLRGFDPWTREVSSQHGEAPTLEAAIAGHISRFSGGQQFTVSDLVAIMSERPVILILDALDEVADLTDRQEVVSQIEAFAERHQDRHNKIVIIVTSRPTAISNAPSLPYSKFYHLTLGAITGKIATEYAHKWAKVRRLPSKDARELIETLEDKLQSPHMAELAKNTMQLTILLSLMVARGSSLPDKRTELYTAYLEQFLNRESEKSPDVRDNRDLLLDIHGYLGYYLHAQAESRRGTGRISVTDLRALLRDYLARQKHKDDMVDKLFNAVVGRVVALVPRIEGTFEFEVQPLREYFAGRYLYETAPTSPPWEKARGTRSDRFDGISANPYWLNVTRFFAGFFRKGELADLALRVKDLIEDPSRRGQSYPRELAFSLLQDWVFTQSPRATELVVSAIFEGEGLYWTADTSLRIRGRLTGTSFALSKGAGAEEAFEIVWNALVTAPQSHRTIEFCHLIKLYGTPSEIYTRWLHEYQAATGDEKRIWTILGLRLGCSDRASKEPGLHWPVSDATADSIDRSITLVIAATTPAPSRLLTTDLIWEYVKTALDASVLRSLAVRPNSDIYATILAASHPHFWGTLVSAGDHTRYRQASRFPIPKDLNRSDDAAAGILKTLLRTHSERAAFTLQPWSDAITALESVYGRTATSLHLGVMAAGITSSTERGGRANQILSEDFPLPSRIRYARRQAKSVDWWTNQFSEAKSAADYELILTASTIWAKTEVLIAILEQVDEAAKRISSSQFTTFLSFIDAYIVRPPHIGKDADLSALGSRLASSSTRAAQILLRRVNPAHRWNIIDSWILTSEPAPEVLADVATDIVAAMAEGHIGSQRALDLLERVPFILPGAPRSYRLETFPSRSALRKARVPITDIIARCRNLPTYVSQLAWEVGRMRMKSPTPVTTVAKNQAWFNESFDW